ncbi:MAG: GGDEF domain-containing protein [Desulfosporosinus sp.]|nr:GGDEF domain-containing protein [Desulfosporosinus sp.]
MKKIIYSFEITGLGLVICYSIATHNNGKIDIKTGSRGTNFLFDLKIMKVKIYIQGFQHIFKLVIKMGWVFYILLPKNYFKYTPVVSFVITTIMSVLVYILKVPNPNVILLTIIVFFSFQGGFFSGAISGLIVIAYSIYFFSTSNQLFHYTQENFKKIIVIVIFIPIMVFIVGTLKRRYLLKSKELELVNEKLQTLSRIDELTCISNRRFFNEVLVNEYKRAARMQIPISLIMIDIDFFKNYNDYYGHILGDKCLKDVANAINEESKRTGDFLARYGGEEFMVLLPNTDINGAKGVGDRIINAVASLKIPHKASTISSSVTVSAGIVTMASFEGCEYHNLPPVLR